MLFRELEVIKYSEGDSEEVLPVLALEGLAVLLDRLN